MSWNYTPLHGTAGRLDSFPTHFDNDGQATAKAELFLPLRPGNLGNLPSRGFCCPNPTPSKHHTRQKSAHNV